MSLSLYNIEVENGQFGFPRTNEGVVHFHVSECECIYSLHQLLQSDLLKVPN